MSIHLWQAPPLPFDRREIFRYAGMPVPSENDTLNTILDDCLREAEQMIRCRGVWRIVSVDIPFLKEAGSRSTERFLAGCREVILLAVTAGREGDRFIARNQVRSPLHGLMAHAIGTERVETACDAMCEELDALFPGELTDGRFSPGYGDLPLRLQRDFFDLLDCEKYLGMSLMSSLLMSPSKSVTALIGKRSAS